MIEQEKREKVIKGLECCAEPGRNCSRACPYYDEPKCETALINDTYAVVKAQEPRVMTLEELRMNEVYWAEQDDILRPWPIAMHHIRNAGLLDGPVYQDYMGENYNTKEYGKTWRCWTERPTDEQREATPWNAQS